MSNIFKGLLTIIAFSITSYCFAANVNDIIFLRNGTPDSTLKIRTDSAGNIVFYDKFNIQGVTVTELLESGGGGEAGIEDAYQDLTDKGYLDFDDNDDLVKKSDLTLNNFLLLDGSNGPITGPLSVSNQFTANSFKVSSASAGFVKTDANGDFTFGNTISVAHSDTTGLQGGTSGQYYHLTSAQSSSLALILAAYTNSSVTPNGGTLTITGSANITSQLTVGYGTPNAGDVAYATNSSGLIDFKDPYKLTDRATSFVISDSSTNAVIGDGIVQFTVGPDLNGFNLINVVVSCYSKGVTGTTTVQVRRRRAGVNADMLSTRATLADEWVCSDEAINATYDDLLTGDQIYIDIDTVHTTPPKGLGVNLNFRKP